MAASPPAAGRRVPYRLRPGGGFLVLLGSIGAALTMLAVGLSTPRLQRVWEMTLELETGARGRLDDRELATLQGALCDYPELAEDQLIAADSGGRIETGVAYLLRRRESGARAVLVHAPESKKDPRIEVTVRTLSQRGDGTATRGAPFAFRPANHRGCATVIEVSVAPRKKKQRFPAFSVTLEGE